MKKLTIILSFVLLIIAGCGKDEKAPESSDNNNKNKSGSELSQNNTAGENTAVTEGETVEIKLPTMQCKICKKTIEGELKKIDGIKEVNVVVKEKVAKVTYDKSKTDLNVIEGVIVSAGYQANEKPADKEAYENLDDCCKVGGH